MDQTPPVPPPPGTSLFEMDIDPIGQNHLNTISKWGKFISVTSLILLGLVIALMAFNYQEISNRIGELFAFDTQTAGILLAVIIIFMGLILVVLFFLLRGCSLIKQGLIAQNNDRIADGFRALKVVFTIGLVISCLTLVSAIYTLIIS